jgi:hypothetical protein
MKYGKRIIVIIAILLILRLIIAIAVGEKSINI